MRNQRGLQKPVAVHDSRRPLEFYSALPWEGQAALVAIDVFQGQQESDVIILGAGDANVA